jgi:uncharacterized protein YcbK (DUF882 family)
MVNFILTLCLIGSLVLASNAYAKNSVKYKDGVTIKKKSALDDFFDKFAKDNNVDIVITSAHRSKERNKKVGGLPNSKHLTPGAARDIRTKNLSKKTIIKLIKELKEAGFVVVDERKKKAHLHIHKN